MIDAGVDSPLGQVLGSIRSVVAGVDVDGLPAQSAARLVEECAEAERLLAALRVVATAILQDKALWRRGGVPAAGPRGGSQNREARGGAAPPPGEGHPPRGLPGGGGGVPGRRIS